MNELILYNNFINTDLHTSLRGDGGNELYADMLEYINNVKGDKATFEKIKSEIEIWFKVGRSSYFIMAVNLIRALNLIEYKSDLEVVRLKIIKKQISDLPDYIIMFIDNTLKALH